MSGITTIVDNSTCGMGGTKAEELAEPTIGTYRKVGIRAIYGRMIADQFPPEYETYSDLLKRRNPEIVHVPFELISPESPDKATIMANITR